MTAPRTITVGLELDLGALAKAIAAELAQLGGSPAAGERPPYHQDHLPPGETRRSYLDKARRGLFVSSKTGRSVLCRADDWDAYVTMRQRAPRPRAAAANDSRPPSDRDLLAAAGVTLRPAARRG